MKYATVFLVKCTEYFWTLYASVFFPQSKQFFLCKFLSRMNIKHGSSILIM